MRARRHSLTDRVVLDISWLHGDDCIISLEVAADEEPRLPLLAHCQFECESADAMDEDPHWESIMEYDDAVIHQQTLQLTEAGRQPLET